MTVPGSNVNYDSLIGVSRATECFSIVEAINEMILSYDQIQMTEGGQFDSNQSIECLHWASVIGHSSGGGRAKTDGPTELCDCPGGLEACLTHPVNLVIVNDDKGLKLLPTL